MTDVPNSAFTTKSDRHRPTVAVLALPGTMLSAVATATDVFSTAGVMWNRIQRIPESPVFDVKLVSPDGRPVLCAGIPHIAVHGAMHDVHNADLVVITALIGNTCNIETLRDVVSWLRGQHERGGALASLCTGAFVLAATGLLDGKMATTHWGAAKRLQRMHPRVNVTPHRLLTDEGTLFTSGGSHGAMNLCLHLVERFAGREIAVQSAKVMMRDFETDSQLPYTVFLQEKDHNDNEIATIQDYMDCAYYLPVTVMDLAHRAGLGRRTFERRFKSATGCSPKSYLQNLRIEAAKRILETDNQTVEQITEAVGYGDAATFSKLFVRVCGVSPSAYRRKFAVASSAKWQNL
ncbi:MAG: helix-turn-helix domain-containing protein [Deltaproteobacteria bacterium]|nr:helix-turn-helix domain-containing protein [Deltaproteobacteria bacterium]